MANVLKRKSLNVKEDLLLVETQVSNTEAGHQFGTFARLSVIVLPKNEEFRRISQKESKVLSSDIFRKSLSKSETFKSTKRYLNSEEAKVIKSYEALYEDALNGEI